MSLLRLRRVILSSPGLPCRPSAGVPGSGIDRADGVAGDIGIVQRLDVEIDVPIARSRSGKAAQQLRKFAALPPAPPPC